MKTSFPASNALLALLAAAVSTTTTTNAFTFTSSFVPAVSVSSSRSTAFAVQQHQKRHQQKQRLYQSSTSSSTDNDNDWETVIGEECIITPEGYGFSTPTERVLKKSKRGTGFYRAAAADRVIDVMEAITTGNQDVALVFEENEQLLGIFTETDYIKVCHGCCLLLLL